MKLVSENFPSSSTIRGWLDDDEEELRGAGRRWLNHGTQCKDFVGALTFIVEELLVCRREVSSTLVASNPHGRSSGREEVKSEPAGRAAQVRQHRDQLLAQLKEAKMSLEEMVVERCRLAADLEAAAEQLRVLSRDCESLSLHVETTRRELLELQQVMPRGLEAK
eukprot:763658-Hanusia_phi.AAC.14